MASAQRVRGQRSGDADTVRRALLEAAKSQFAQRGYEGASTREILSEAGVTAPVLYHHFGNKAGLYRAVAAHVMDVVVGTFEEAVTPGAGLRANLDAILDASIAIQAQDRQLPQFVLAAPLDLARHFELADAEPEMNRLRKFVEGLCRAEREPGLSPKLAVRVVLTLIYGLSRYAATLAPKEFAPTADAVRALALGNLFDTQSA
jgi:AcrR family transcriptional regulator